MKKIFFIILVLFSFQSFAQELIKGDKAPEIELPNPDGEVMKLSDLKGHIVLIDFWASWCGPCRRANPGVVKLYKKYKDKKFKNAKGFTVYSVSLDKNKGGWVKAIEQDGLEWEYHVSDLKFWNSAAGKDYHVNSIPNTYLINENGEIIGHNMNKKDLEFELIRRLK